MQDDPLRHDIEMELRGLRTKPGRLDLGRIATAEILTDVVGRGSTERAYTTLMGLLERYGSDSGGDIRAYFETCGVDLEGDTLNQRLDAYQARHYVDRRTGLRRSDRGAKELSIILRDGLKYERPWGNIALTETNGLVRVRVWVDVFPDAMWRRPHVYINGELQERQWVLHDAETETEPFVTAVETFGNIPLLPAERDEDLFEITVYWVMPIWPVWKVGAQLHSPGIYAVLTTERDPGASVAICTSPGPNGHKIATA